LKFHHFLAESGGTLGETSEARLSAASRIGEEQEHGTRDETRRIQARRPVDAAAADMPPDGACSS